MIYNEEGYVDVTAVIGVMVGFLVVGVIGIYVGDTMINAANMSLDSSMSAATVMQTFEMGVVLCKCTVIVAVASIMFVLFQELGAIPTFHEPRGSGGYSSGSSGNASGYVQTPPTNNYGNGGSSSGSNEHSSQQTTTSRSQSPIQPPHEKEHPQTRWESLDIVQDKDE